MSDDDRFDLRHRTDPTPAAEAGPVLGSQTRVKRIAHRCCGSTTKAELFTGFSAGVPPLCPLVITFLAAGMSQRAINKRAGATGLA